MKPLNRISKRFALALCVLWLGLSGRQAAQSPPMTITPADPTIFAGETQHFTANGAITPTVVSAGGEYTCVRLPDGTVRCAGRNQFGQLGDGNWTNSSVLVPVSGITTATSVIAGDEFVCALLANGTASCWGLGEKGQRGDGTFTQISLVPVAVSGLTNAVAVSAGYNHTCALLADGTMRCWGDNLHGQLGDPTVFPGPSSVPVTVSGITGATKITAGAFHTCALLADATLRCWGHNGQGQLGDGTMTNSSTPVQVGGLTGVVDVSGGAAHTCAVLANGTMQCWGNNYDGQLGDGTGVPSPTPVSVTGITNAVAVSAGWAHTCARLQDGTIRCWGENLSGQLGDGTMLNSTAPVTVTGIAGAVGLTSGWWHHSCALLADGRVRCWGTNEWGQFGNGTTTSSSVPVTMSGTGLTWSSSNTAIATIDGTGRATGVSLGLTTITATDSLGATATTTLRVRDRFTLSIVRSGAGTGSVSSSPSGISCGTDCSELYDNDTNVTLTATAASNSTVAGWIGCDTASGATCTVTMSAAKTVTAIFDLKRFILTVNKAGLGADHGNVSSSPSGISCGTDCYEVYTIGTVVTLTASPGVLVTGWSGCDTASEATCTVNMASDKSVTATFVGLP